MAELQGHCAVALTWLQATESRLAQNVHSHTSGASAKRTQVQVWHYALPSGQRITPWQAGQSVLEHLMNDCHGVHRAAEGQAWLAMS